MLSPSRVIRSVADLRQANLDPEKVRAHVLRPGNLEGVVSDRGPLEPIRGPGFELPKTPGLFIFDPAGFAVSLHAALQDQVAGYAMRLLHHGLPIQTRIWNWAKTPSDGRDLWTDGTRMHVASVSKFITAVAMLRLLQERQVALDTPIIGFLPAYWTKGPNVDRITFRHLLTHRSGFNTGDKSDSDFLFMKTQVAAGVGAVDSFTKYENMNFGLCRILTATVLGTLSPAATFKVDGIDLNDVHWDAVAISIYSSWVHFAVFAPAGVSGPGLDRLPADALAYDFPVSGGGWNSGPLQAMAGGIAWHMSVDELAKVLSMVRRGGAILPAERLQAMLDSGIGIDEKKETPLGPLYWKGGRWGDPKKRLEQSLVFFLPRDMELAVLTNSPVSATDQTFPDVVYSAYAANIRPATSLRDFLIRHGVPVTSSVHPLTAPTRSLRATLPA